MASPILRAVGSKSDDVAQPSQWERVGVQRLAWVTGLATISGGLGSLLVLLRQPNLGIRAGTERPLLIPAVWGALSLLTWFALRSNALKPARRLDLGLVYLVVTCFMGGLFRHWLPYAESDVVRGASPVALAVLFFAAVVPVPPFRMAVAAIAASLADVLALACVNQWLVQPSPPWNLWLWLFAPNVFAVAIAIVTSRFLHQLAETVRRVREMGAYRLVKKLGSGGMGEVWRAEHQGLARPAAIKLVRAELLGGDPEKVQRLLTRFEREARATAALTSPHTIAVYDYGRAEDGSFYYVMELLDGLDLETLVARHGRLPPERAVYLLVQICDSLHDAHRQGLVHRDIKPANIMICRQGAERDFVKVLDFGLVKLEPTAQSSDDADDEAKLTAEGTPLGTPAYMAPEVARGNEATPLSDVYAFGCVAYWLLAGRLVFADARGAMGQLVAHGQDPPDSIADHVVLSGELTDLVMACLEKDPAKRPSSMAVVQRRLRDTDLAERWTRTHSHEWWSEVDLPALIESEGELDSSDPALLATMEAPSNE